MLAVGTTAAALFAAAALHTHTGEATLSISVADEQYIETVPFQFAYKGSAQPHAPNWGVLPEACCIGEVQSLADRSTLLKFDSGGVYVATRNNASSDNLVRSGNIDANADAAYTVGTVDTSGVVTGHLSDASSRLLVDPVLGGVVVGVVSSIGVAPVNCDFSKPACTSAGSATTAFSFGSIVDVVYSGGSGSGELSFLVVSEKGLYSVGVASTGKCQVKTLREEAGLTAVGVAPFTGSPPVSPRASGAATAIVAGPQHLCVRACPTCVKCAQMRVGLGFGFWVSVWACV